MIAVVGALGILGSQAHLNDKVEEKPLEPNEFYARTLKE